MQTNRSAKIYHIIICVIVVALSNCKISDDNPVIPTTPTTEIIPLKIGNSWTYSETTFDTSGSVKQTIENTEKVFRDTMINGQTLYSFDSLTKYIWYKNTDTGFIQVFTKGGLKAALIYKYPTSFGDVFISNDLGVTVTEIKSTIVVPAGTFACVKYEFNYGLHLYDVYIHPGLGEIKRVSYFAFYANPLSGKKDTVSSINVLKSYHLN